MINPKILQALEVSDANSAYSITVDETNVSQVLKTMATLYPKKSVKKILSSIPVSIDSIDSIPVSIGSMSSSPRIQSRTKPINSGYIVKSSSKLSSRNNDTDSKNQQHQSTSRLFQPQQEVWLHK